MRSVQDRSHDMGVADECQADARRQLRSRSGQVKPSIRQVWFRDLLQQPTAPEQCFKLVIARDVRKPRVIKQR
ncbi:MAG: hypothetical protein B7Z52_07560, partial [Burkholderiales bacterium 12-64-5]